MGKEMVNARRPCFYEIFSANLTGERLRIPPRFVKYMEGRASGSVVSLMGPSGNVWPVSLVQLNEDVFLDHGWPTFVRDHFVECGNLLVFRYDGELCFTVQVFDQSACEKEAAFSSKCSQEYNGNVGQKREREEEALCLQNNLESMTKKVRGCTSKCHSECVDRYWEAGVDECCEGEVQHGILKVQCGSPLKASATFSQAKAFNGKSDTAIRKRLGKEDDLNMHNRGYGSVFSEREKRVAQSFTSCFPYFVRIMKRFNISGSYTLNIPYQFSMAHLPDCKTEIVLRTVKGASWTVNSVPTTRVHTSHTFCGGWMAFVRNNGIELGDVCIFELVRKLELRVFILRVGREGPENESGTITSNGVSVGCAAIAHESGILPKKLRKNSLKAHSKLMKQVEMCEKKGSKKSHISKPGNSMKGSAGALLSSWPRTGKEKQEKNARTRKNVEVGLALQAGAGLRMMVARDEEKAAKSFVSCFPNFVRIMRKFNISGSYTLKIPHKFSAAHLPNCKTEIALRNQKGQSWIVNSVPDSKGRTVHTFCGGWMAFVRDNDIQMGDICIFELVSNCEMRVHITGVGRIATSNDLPLGVFSGNHPPL